MIQYLSFNFVTNFESCMDCKPQFPDVTVCNLNLNGGAGLLSNVPYSDYLYQVSELQGNTYQGQPRFYLEESWRNFQYLYSTQAYVNNVIYGDGLASFFLSPGSQNLLVHQCQWYVFKRTLIKRVSLSSLYFWIHLSMKTKLKLSNVALVKWLKNPDNIKLNIVLCLYSHIFLARNMNVINVDSNKITKLIN